jgi:hypothetical protein
VSATVHCDYCAWSAKMRGDTPLEVAVFLRARLIEHIENDCQTPGAAMLRHAAALVKVLQ